MKSKKLGAFEFATRINEFDEAWTRQLQNQMKRVRDKVVPERNTQRFSHGRTWRTAPSNGGDEEGELSMHSTELQLKFEDIVSHNLSSLPALQSALVADLERQFMGSLYETLGRSTEKTGNVVRANEHHSMADAFLEILRKIEFGVNQDGEISLPELHLGHEAHVKMMASLSEQGVEFHEEVERIKAYKSAAALDRERERLAKFPKMNEEK
ncbi:MULTISPECIES: hypothetical protein [unclassified Phyllobacterium]|uniref:hypothetical protein n=1 Tax=unclassified Phyllobacterium TaxID=2638441 RepID=UPI003012E770